MASEQMTDAARGPERAGGRPYWLIALMVGVVLLTVVAYILIPPFPKGQPGQPAEVPIDFINANLEFPAPHVVIDLDPSSAPPADQIIIFHPSITSTILMSWIIMAILIPLILLLTRRRDPVPGRAQNLAETVYETLSNFGTSLGGAGAVRYIPLFAALFIFILACNWSGLIPPVGKIEELRAPTSDVNITIGLALVAFFIFEMEGFRALGVRGYLGKFFPLGAFRNGVGAGLIAMFVGIVELMLEFVKPVTLSMRLFGNIYGGEVALGVITALTISIIPVALLGLEFLLNLVQALIFSVLTLMFILAAIEGHHEEEGHEAHA